MRYMEHVRKLQLVKEKNTAEKKEQKIIGAGCNTKHFVLA